MATVEAIVEMKFEGINQVKLSIMVVEYIRLKVLLSEYKDQRRKLHESGKCAEGDCLRTDDFDYIHKPDFESLCGFCKQRHDLYLKVKNTSAKMRGMMARIQRLIVRSDHFKKLNQ